MSVISMKQLLEAGVHFGHQTRRWNPKMAEYIYTERNGIYIIDLQKSVGMVDDAYKAVSDIAAEGGTILFVGTKKQAQDAIKVEAERCGMYYVNERWLGGMLTNFKTIQSRIARLKEIEAMQEDGTFDVLPKKEVIALKKELDKLQKNLGGIKDMKRIPDAIFIEKPMLSDYHTISTGIYVIRRRQLIEMIERCAQEGRHDFVKDILIRYKNLKRIYGYKIQDYWNNISTVEAYYKTNMDFLKPEVRDYFFRQYPGINSKIDDLPPAKYNPGCLVKNSLVSSGCIINGQVENSVLFKKVYVGNNCVIKNSIILNDVYLGDNTHIENCIVESRDTIRANSYYCGEGEIKVVVEKNERYAL